MNIKLKEDVNNLINYAVKEGYLDAEEAQKMNWQQKIDYYNRCEAYEPEEE